MKTKKTTKTRTKTRNRTKTIFILTVILFFGLSFNLLDFDFNNEASAVIYSNKWQMDTNLSESDASFIGENAEDYSGYKVSIAGDVNNDGFDDFLIAELSEMMKAALMPVKST